MDKKASSLPGYPLRLLRQRLAHRRAQLADPAYGEFSRGPAFDGATFERFAQRTPKLFPVFEAGRTSTRDYINEYEKINRVARPTTCLQYTFRNDGRHAPFIIGPEVIEETGS